jgi:predicted Zn finger-like uncharacterized protein
MILTCSSCSTRFLVDAAAIGATGRNVRCARCQHGWFQEPAADLPLPSAMKSGPDDMVTPETAAPVNAGAPGTRPAPLRRGANLPAIPRRAGRVVELMAWGALAIFAASLAGAGYVFREQIVNAWPQAAKLYMALGVEIRTSQLRLSDVSFSQATQEGRRTLMVIGAISNDGSAEITMPLVLVKLRNAAGRDIFQWTHQLPEPALAPGASVKFETSLADPPAEARNLEVTFAPQR